MNAQELIDTASTLVAGVKGLLAMDESKVGSLWRTVPAAVPGIAFLSGGQSAELASARLNGMNLRFKSRLPWALTFSFSRAIQQPALEIWRGEESPTCWRHNELCIIESCAIGLRAVANTVRRWRAYKLLDHS